MAMEFAVHGIGAIGRIFHPATALTRFNLRYAMFFGTLVVLRLHCAVPRCRPD